jgi:GNAT superfamily N-acetyltransferase
MSGTSTTSTSASTTLLDVDYTNFRIVIMRAEHDDEMCDIITQCGHEFNLIGDDGFGPNDTEVKTMSQYNIQHGVDDDDDVDDDGDDDVNDVNDVDNGDDEQKEDDNNANETKKKINNINNDLSIATERDQIYFVANVDNVGVVGGCGIAPFAPSLHKHVAELRKLYTKPEARGSGVGSALMRRCLHWARRRHCYTSVYLDSCSSMKSARRLYQRFGFVDLDESLPGVVHTSCDVYMLKTF